MSDRRLSVELKQESPIALDLSFTCDAHDVLAIFGPSGSGKTTVLRSIAGLHSPSRAVVRSGPATWADSTSGIWWPTHKRPVGFVFQEYALFPHLTALGNVAAALGHRPRHERRGVAERLLGLVRLAHASHRRPHQLSGGERQRVALARALAREPDVLLLDEPFAAVDRAVRRELQDEVDAIRRALAIPLILVSHDFDDVARLATDVLLIEQGKPIAHGPLHALTTRSDLDWLRDAVGLGSVLDGVVARRDPDRGLVEIACGGCRLLAPGFNAPAKSRVRVRIPAREVILASSPAPGLSLHNVLEATVAELHSAPRGDVVVVRLAVGDTLLLAEITRDAVRRLGVAPGRRVYALIKSVSLQVMPSQ